MLSAREDSLLSRAHTHTQGRMVKLGKVREREIESNYTYTTFVFCRAHTRESPNASFIHISQLQQSKKINIIALAHKNVL